jgi:hypothetical protein
MDDRRVDGAVGSGLPWASVFDPVANVKALSDVQLRALRAAGALVDRLVASIDDAWRDFPPDPVAETPPRGQRDLAAPRTSGGPRGPVGDLVALWADFVTRSMQAMARLSQPHSGVWVDVGTGERSGPLRVTVDAHGRSAPSAEVWLHNTTTQPVGPLRLHAGELRPPVGPSLSREVVHFEPPIVEELPGRSSRGVGVSIRVADPVPPGTYRTIVQAAGATQVALVLELTVGTSVL